MDFLTNDLSDEARIFRLCDLNRETSFAIHRYPKHGHLEKIYENALAHRLRKLGIKVEQQFPLKVFDEEGTILGDYFADLFIEESLIVELKACQTLVMSILPRFRDICSLQKKNMVC